MDSNFYIVGAGGIGCALGYALARDGFDLAMVEANSAKVDWGQRNGLAFNELPPQEVAFIHFDDWRPPPGSTVLLCTKCYDNSSVLARLPDGVSIIPIQNGFDPILKEKAEGGEGIASFVSECRPDRPQTRITRKGHLFLGPRSKGRGSANTALRKLADLLRFAPFRVRVVDDILPFKYSKLMYNSAISPLAAAAGLDNGQLLSVRIARRLFFGLLRENYQILTGAGIALARIGPFHPRTVQRVLNRPAVANLASLFFYPTLRGSYCSMSGDLPRGRTEIDYYNGHLIDLADKFGLSCPLNRDVYALVKRLERDRLAPALHWLSQLQSRQCRAA